MDGVVYTGAGGRRGVSRAGDTVYVSCKTEVGTEELRITPRLFTRQEGRTTEFD